MYIILGADGKEYGPVTLGNVVEWIRDGRANLATKARKADETGWKTLGEFSEFVPTGSSAPFVAPPAPVVETDPVPPLPAFTPTLPLAGLGRRFAAALIDGFLQWLCALPASFAFLAALNEKMAGGTSLPPVETLMQLMGAAMQKSVPYFVALALVQITLLTLRSQSVGKLVLRIRIVTVRDGLPGGFLRAFLLRSFPTWLMKQIPIVGLLYWLVDSFTIFREDQRCLHDLIAGTKVVKLPKE